MVPVSALLLELKGLAEHRTHPVAPTLIIGRNKATIWDPKKKKKKTKKNPK